MDLDAPNNTGLLRVHVFDSKQTAAQLRAGRKSATHTVVARGSLEHAFVIMVRDALSYGCHCRTTKWNHGLRLRFETTTDGRTWALAGAGDMIGFGVGIMFWFVKGILSAPIGVLFRVLGDFGIYWSNESTAQHTHRENSRMAVWPSKECVLSEWETNNHVQITAHRCVSVWKPSERCSQFWVHLAPSLGHGWFLRRAQGAIIPFFMCQSAQS